MRGRNNNGGNNNNGNRKSPNPLQRSYESNGPDVKVRGTAQHVAEKYLQLARDAQSSGDTVASESYFQHAEHYYRILLAAQEQMTQQFGHTFPPNRAFVDVEDEVDEDGEDDGQGGYLPGAGPQPDLRGQNGHMNGNGYNGHGGQRAEGGQRSEGGEGFDGQQQGGQRFDRPNRRERFNNNDRRFDRNQQDRNPQQDRGERRFDRNGEQGQGGYAPRQDIPRSDIPVGGDEAGFNAEAAPQPQPQPQVNGERSFERPERGPRPERRPRRERQPAPEADDVASALPSFLTNPVRTVVAEPAAAETAAPSPVETADEALAEAPKRTRRRRSPREVMDALGSDTDGSTE
jgi:hypothetical protein